MLAEAAFSATKFGGSLEIAASQADQLITRLSTRTLAKFQDQLAKSTQSTSDRIADLGRTFFSFTAQLRRENTRIAADIEATWDTLKESLNNTLDEPLKNVRTRVQEIRSEANRLLADSRARGQNLEQRRVDLGIDQRLSAIDKLPEEQALKQFYKERHRLENQATQAIVDNNIDLYQQLITRADQLEADLTQRLQRLKEQSSEIIQEKQIIGFDRTGSPIEVNTSRINNQQAAQQSTQRLARLERERFEIAKERIALETAFIQRQEQQANLLAQQAKDQEQVLKAFESTLAKIDSFDVTNATKDSLSEFKALIETASRQSGAAGLDNADRIGFLRNARQLAVQGERSVARQQAAQELQTLEDAQQKQINLLKEANEARSNLSTEVKTVLTQELPREMATTIERLSGFLKDIKGTLDSDLVGDEPGESLLSTEADASLRFAGNMAEQLLPTLDKLSLKMRGLAQIEGLDSQIDVAREMKLELDLLADAIEAIDKESTDLFRANREPLFNSAVYLSRVGRRDGSLQSGINQGPTLQELTTTIRSQVAQLNIVLPKYGQITREQDKVQQGLFEIENTINRLQFEFKGDEALKAAQAIVRQEKRYHDVLDGTIQRLQRIRQLQLQPIQQQQQNNPAPNVNNNNINITVPAGTTQSQAQDLANQINRLQRSGRI